MRGNKNRRKGISPIIATLTLVAVTLVAAVAVGGFVFGVFGTQTSTPQVTVVYAYIPSDLDDTGLAATTDDTAPPPYGKIMVKNVGTSSVDISGLTLTFGQSKAYAEVQGDDTTIPAGETKTIYITALQKEAAAGQQFTGAVILSNGAQVFFTGTFA